VSTAAPIVVALSGGVDSATVAAMLVEAGHHVVGITMRLYDARGTAASAGGRCCGPRDIEDARRVCAHLGIPFYVVDFSEEFRRHVVDDFVTTYLAGQTPNPCVRCNQHIKFTPLLRRARALGADMLATGHYARIEARGGTPRLLRGRDPDKDQSYFLFSMPVHELGALSFPLGELRKEEVRERARRYGLPNASKDESHEICFVPDGDHAGFVARSALGRPPQRGTFVDLAGKVLGEHDGIHRFTVGQRRGLGNLAGGRPQYVVRVDPARQQVVVGERADAAATALRIGDVQWFSPVPAPGSRVELQVRYRARPVHAEITGVDRDVTVRVVDEGVIAAPGQAAVFYRGDEVLGGGWIRPSAGVA
jgi:tRNA-specific 2-thiouridylase